MIFDSIMSLRAEKALGQVAQPNVQQLIRIGAASTSNPFPLPVIISNIQDDPTYTATSGASKRFLQTEVGTNTPIYMSSELPASTKSATITLPAIRMNGSKEATLYYYVIASSTATTLVTTIELSNNYDPKTGTGEWYGTDDVFWSPNNPIGTLPSSNGYRIAAASSTMMNWNAGSFPGANNATGKSFKLRNIQSRFFRVLLSTSGTSSVAVEITRD